MQRVFKKSNSISRRPRGVSGNSQSDRNRLSGSKFIPSDDPPVISGQPWNSIVIDTSFIIGTGSFSYFKFKDLHACLLNQAGFNGAKSVDFEVRFQSVSLWSVETGDVQHSRLCVMIMDLFNDNSVELVRLDSNSMRNKYSKVGYNYPLSHSSAPIKVMSISDAVIISAQSSVAATGVIHLRVLWRGLNAGFKISSEKWVKFNMPSSFTIPRSSDGQDDDESIEYDRLVDGIGKQVTDIILK